jgi:hypothetical protein
MQCPPTLQVVQTVIYPSTREKLNYTLIRQKQICSFVCFALATLLRTYQDLSTECDGDNNDRVAKLSLVSYVSMRSRMLGCDLSAQAHAKGRQIRSI